VDVIGPAGFLTNLIGRIAYVRSNRPRLAVKIILYRPDKGRKRLVFRASVLNCGQVIASHCEGFWTIFAPDFSEVSSGNSVFWCPADDKDWNFQNREFRSAAIGYNERRFCWAELDITRMPVEGTNIRLFPYSCASGCYAFALVVEYGQYRSFDFVGIDIPKYILGSASEGDAIDMISVRWQYRHGLSGLRHARRIRKFVASTDYHNYVRPT
jgi:hypothetical protein